MLGVRSTKSILQTKLTVWLLCVRDVTKTQPQVQLCRTKVWLEPTCWSRTWINLRHPPNTRIYNVYIYKYLIYTPAPTVLNSQLWSPLLGYLVSPSKIATVLPTNLVGAKPLCPNWPINPSPAVGRCHRDRTSRGFPPAIFWWWGRINPYENSDSNGFRTQQFVLTR